MSSTCTESCRRGVLLVGTELAVHDGLVDFILVQSTKPRPHPQLGLAPTDDPDATTQPVSWTTVYFGATFGLGRQSRASRVTEHR
jgi:hypothetical protein